MRREDFEDRYRETIRMIQRRFQVLVQQSSDVFEVISPDGTIQYISPAVERITGHTPEERLGRSTLEPFRGRDKIRFRKMIEFALENPDKQIDGDIVLKTEDGRETHLNLVISNHLSEPSINGLVINWRDITERVEKEREIQFVATHDELTKLPNQLYLKNKLGELCCDPKSKEGAFALFMLNIDGFKYINDALGHQLGDQLIISVGQRLKAYTTNGKIVCRYSGDQYAIIIRGSKTTEEYEGIVEEIRALFHSPFKVDMFELEISVSIGISVFPDDEEDIEGLINYANIALLRAKQEGKSKHQFYSSDIGIETYKQLILRNDLIKAIEKNQIKVHYQPIVNIETNEILALEALMRWEHPDCGMVSPNEFIGLAEETGFIINLGNWMLKEVCKDYKEWKAKEMAPIKISVNYSSIQFFERDFVENIMRTIEEANLDPRFLIMEITESIFMKNAERAIVDIKRLQSYGISIALDDFGTGYSSLSYLNTFNLDMLKIDRSFIKNALSDRASDIITRAVINLAVELNIKLVAEGIETWEQLSYLRGLKCFAGQGYLFTKPMSFNDLLKTLTAGNRILPYKNNEEKTKELGKRRQHRIILPEGIHAEVIVAEGEKESSSAEKNKAIIKNISAEGMCLSTNSKLTVDKENLIQVEIDRLDDLKALCGYTVWENELSDQSYEYGVKMDIDQQEKQKVAQALYALCKSQYIN